MTKKITPAEEIQFAVNMGYNSFTKLNESYLRITQLAKNVGNNVPELKTYQSEDRKLIIKEALTTIYEEKPSKVLTVTIGDCWLTWATCNFACVWCCFENDFLLCQGVCDLAFLLCWAFAD